MRKILWLMLLVALATGCPAQTTRTTATQEGNNTYTGANTYLGKYDASGASETEIFKTGTLASRPGTCTALKSWYAQTDGIQGIYRCNASGNGWLFVFSSASNLTPVTFPNSVNGLQMQSGSFFGFPPLDADPNTATWGSSQRGACWWNNTAQTGKCWNGSAIVTGFGGSASTPYAITSITAAVGSGIYFGSVVTTTANPFIVGQAITVFNVTCDTGWNGSWVITSSSDSTHFVFSTGSATVRTTCGAGGFVVAGAGGGGGGGSGVSGTGTSGSGACWTGTTALGTCSFADDGAKSTFKIVNKKILVDQIPDCTAVGGAAPCTDASQQWNQCRANLVLSGGGTCDLTGYGPSSPALTSQQVVATDQSTPGGDGTGITYLFDSATKFQIGYTGAACAIVYGPKNSFVTLGSGSTIGSGGLFNLLSTANVTSVFCPKNPTGLTAHVIFRGLSIQGNFSATNTVSLIDAQSITDRSTFEQLVLYNCKARCLFVRTASGSASGPIKFLNMTLNAGTGSPATALPLEVKAETGGLACCNFDFDTLTVNRAGSGQPLIFVNGNNVNTGQGLQAINFRNVYCEPGYAGADCLKILDAQNITVEGLMAGNGGATAANVVRIAETTAGNDNNITIKNLRIQAGSGNTVQDDVNGLTFGGYSWDLWVFRPKNFSTAQTIFLPSIRWYPFTFLEMNGWTAPNGTQIYCANCDATCSGGAGTGKMCYRLNGTWTN